jgi:hypothetical protein
MGLENLNRWCMPRKRSPEPPGCKSSCRRATAQFAPKEPAEKAGVGSMATTSLADKTPNIAANLTACFNCHKPLDKQDFVFLYDKLKAAAK